MIALETIAEIRRLLAERKCSQREIARRLGVSRGSVVAIALGRRHCGDVSASRVEMVEEPCGPPVRCPGCGAMVYLPCVLCHVRNRRQTSRVVDREESPRIRWPLGMNLRPEQHVRYEDVRRWRQEQGDASLPCSIEGAGP
jgi:transcriptional regulator with XRE-family HTH domain